MGRSEGTAVSFGGDAEGRNDVADEKQRDANGRGAARDNFLSAAVLGNMVSLGSDAGNAGMMAVRHARLIQQLILASGNEASKAYEKWQRRGKTTMTFGKNNTEDLLQNDVRKAGNKLRQRRRGNLLARLETSEVLPASETRFRRGGSTMEFDDEQMSAEVDDGEDDTPKSGEDEESSSDTTTSSSSTSSDDSDEVPGLGFMRMAGRRASLSAEPIPMIAQRRTAHRTPSFVAKPLDLQNGEARKQRQSQVGHWSQLAHLARFIGSNELAGSGGNRASILLPEQSGPILSPRRLSGEGKSEDPNEADAPDDTPGFDRRKLSEVYGSTFRHRTTIQQQFQEPVATLKRLHLDVAARLGLDAEAGDWDPGQTYQMNLSKFEELAELKLMKKQHKAAVWIQARWRSIQIRRPMRQVIYKRLEARKRIREWIRKVIRRKRVADTMQHLRLCIMNAVKIQAHVRRWLLQKEMASVIAFHKVQYRMVTLQEKLYPLEERLRDREALERSMMSAEEVLSQQAESARRKHEADRQRAVAVLQPAVRRWLSRVKAWRLLQEREKELQESRRHRRFRDRDDDEFRPLSRSTFASGPRSGVGSGLENGGVKKVGSGGDADFTRSLGSQSGEAHHQGLPQPSFWHGSAGKALLALEALTTTVEESHSGRARDGSQVRGFRARAFRKSSICLPPPAPPGFRADIAGARGGPKRGTPRLVSVPQPVGRKSKSRPCSDAEN